MENGNPPFGSIAVPGLQQEFHLVYLGGSKKSTRWKSMVRTRLQISLFGWIEKSTRWKRSMVRTRLQLGLFGWIEKSTPWKRSNGPNQTSTWPILVDWKIYAVEKKVWSEPDSTLAYLGGTKNPHGGKEVWSEPDFDLAYFGGLKNPRGGEKKVWSEPDFDLAYFGGSKKKTRYWASGNITEC